MMFTVRPIQNWPDGWQDPKERPNTQFRASYVATLKLLDDELYALGATEAWVQLDVRTDQLRADGALRVDAVVGHPGVILTVITEDLGRLTYATDRYTVHWGSTKPWQANLRAIALGLGALRAVERYGIADRGQQYAGFSAIGRAMGADEGMDEERAGRAERADSHPIIGKYDKDCPVCSFQMLGTKIVHTTKNRWTHQHCVDRR